MKTDIKDDNESEENEKPEFNSLEEPTPELKEDLSNISAAPRQKFLIWSLIGLLASYLLFYFFVLKRNTPTNNVSTTQSNNPGIFSSVSKPTLQSDDGADIPTLPSIPKLYEPTLPTPQPPPPPPASTSTTNNTTRIIKEVVPVPTLPPTINDAPVLPPKIDMVANNIGVNSKSAEEEQKRIDAKRRAGIALMSGSPVVKTPEQIQQAADFVSRGNMSLLLPKGKIIEAVIESAVNSDFGGEIRAIVSRDVYAAGGNKVLISKGSTLFGNYAAGFDGIYARISITWSRIDLAHTNFSVNIASQTVDGLGRMGASGDLDNKYKEKISNVILSSAFNILLARGLDKLVPPVISSSLATTNQALASQLNNIALGIFNDSTITSAAKIPLICAQIQAAIPDKTSSAYLTFTSTCSTIMMTQTGDNPDTKLTTLMAAVNNASSTLIAAITQQTTPTQAQQASKQAFIDVSKSIKDITIRELPKATVTIDQGTHVKIYVNKDYNFPSAAVNKIIRIK